MSHLSVLRKEMCLGRLIWIQPPSSGSAAFFSRKLMNHLGIREKEMIYLTAVQFLRYAKDGFSSEFLKTTRILMIGEWEGLKGKARQQFFSKLSQHRMFKERFDLNLVLVSPIFAETEGGLFQKELNPHSVPLFGGKDPIGINEKIHDYIESAAAEYAKPIWSLSVRAAECLETVLFTQGEDYLKCMIFKAIQHAQGKKLEKKDIDAARLSLISSGSKVDSV